VVVEGDYVEQLRAARLNVEVISRFDYFAGSVSQDTRRVAHGLGAHTIVLRGARAQPVLRCEVFPAPRAQGGRDNAKVLAGK